MKTTDTVEVISGSTGRDEVPEREPARKWRWPAQATHADSPDPHGVDGPDELAFAVGEGAGGVRVAGRILGAIDARYAEFQEAQKAGGAAGSGRRRKGRDRKAGWGGAGSIRLLSTNTMSAQVWIAILVGVAAAVDDLARRR